MQSGHKYYFRNFANKGAKNNTDKDKETWTYF